METRIGTSGWSYHHWEGVLYPPGTPPRQRLELYTGRFDTVELNSSHYHWPRETTFKGWEDRLPAGFRMTVKAPRGLTHSGRLREPERWIPRIDASLRQLGDKLGVFLVQLPPSFERDLPRLEAFLREMPCRMAVAVEFRHESWLVEESFALLERYQSAYCVMSGAQLPCVLRATAPFVYVRLHGPDPHHLYGGSYSDADMDWWSERIREWHAQGRDVWAYFNNDGEGNAVRDAEALKARLTGR